MDSLKELLIPSVSAQAGLDSVAQPTFGPLDLGGGGSTLGNVLISSDKTSAQIGEVVTVTVSINTNDIAIEEYRISLSFDRTKFTVVDADPNTEGTQVTLLDPVFTIEDPVSNNTVSSQGRIRVIAKADSRLAVNRDVIEIKFQAQAAGPTAIAVVSAGETPTELVREAGVGLNFTPNSVNIDVTTTTTEPEPEPQPQPQPEPGNGGTSQPPKTQIPDTALEDFIPAFMPLILGAFLLLLGGSLIRNKNKEEGEKRANH